MVVVAFAFWAGARVFLPDADERDALARAIDDIVETAMEEGPISGVSVAVARGLRVVHSQGYGYADVENERHATPETIYRVGSITKQFTAAAVMQLVDDGRIDLDASVTEYLPDFTAYSGVTVQQLLNHTSGIKNYTSLEDWWAALGVEMTPRRLTEFFLGWPSDFEPGSRFSYTNSGYVLLGMVLEEATGRPYGGLLNERIFVANRLTATAYCDDRRLVPNLAHGYELFDGELRHAQYLSSSQVYAAGAICSSTGESTVGKDDTRRREEPTLVR